MKIYRVCVPEYLVWTEFEVTIEDDTKTPSKDDILQLVCEWDDGVMDIEKFDTRDNLPDSTVEEITDKWLENLKRKEDLEAGYRRQQFERLRKEFGDESL